MRQYMRRLLSTAVLLALVTGCGHGTDKVRQAVEATAATEAALVKGFVQWDHDHQMQIVNQAHSLTRTPQQIQVQLDAYRKQRDKVVEMMGVLQRSLDSAPLILALVDRGLQSDTDLNNYVSDLYTLYTKILSLLQELGFSINGLPGAGSTVPLLTAPLGASQ